MSRLFEVIARGSPIFPKCLRDNSPDFSLFEVRHIKVELEDKQNIIGLDYGLFEHRLSTVVVFSLLDSEGKHRFTLSKHSLRDRFSHGSRIRYLTLASAL